MTVTLVTRGNKGLGRETARRLVELGHTVYIGARDAQRGRTAAELGARLLLRESESPVFVNLSGPGIQTPEESAEMVVRLATIGPDGPTGTFGERAGELPW